MKRLSPLVLFVVLFALAAFATQSAPPALPQQEVVAAPSAPQPAVVNPATETKQAVCQICGDGYCAKSCENEFTCPKDCKPSPSRTAPKTK